MSPVGDPTECAELESEEALAIPAPAPAPTLALARMQPTHGRGELIRLAALPTTLTVGRAEASEIRLYSASASRTHARIELRVEGDSAAWWLNPIPGRAVSIDGTPESEPLPLEIGMNLEFGGDHLRCTEDPGQPADSPSATGLSTSEVAGESVENRAATQTNARVRRDRSSSLAWLLLAAAVVLGGVGLLWVLR